MQGAFYKSRMKKVIGILGGIGPESSADFYKRLILKLQEKKKITKNEDYPQIIINSIPAPELHIDNSNLNQYKKGLKLLEKAGANFIVMVCNTAYLHLKELQKEVKIPIIDLPRIVKEKLKKENQSELLIIGSKRTLNSHLFETKSTIKLKEEDLGKIDDIITKTNIGKNKEEQKSNLLQIIRKYKPKKVVSACTEISSILSMNKGFEIIDTLDLLVEEAIKDLN